METLAVISLIAFCVNLFMAILTGAAGISDDGTYKFLSLIVSSVFVVSYIWLLVLVL